MAASVHFGEALALGLASGPACIAACGPVLVPALLTERAGLRPNAGTLSVFLGCVVGKARLRGSVRREETVSIGAVKSHRASGAAVLGLLTGLSLCPPF